MKSRSFNIIYVERSQPVGRSTLKSSIRATPTRTFYGSQLSYSISTPEGRAAIADLSRQILHREPISQVLGLNDPECEGTNT
jgi:hypothetical protein